MRCPHNPSCHQPVQVCHDPTSGQDDAVMDELLALVEAGLLNIGFDSERSDFVFWPTAAGVDDLDMVPLAG